MKFDNLIIRSPYLSDLPTAPTADSLVNRPVAGDSQPPWQHSHLGQTQTHRPQMQWSNILNARISLMAEASNPFS